MRKLEKRLPWIWTQLAPEEIVVFRRRFPIRVLPVESPQFESPVGGSLFLNGQRNSEDLPAARVRQRAEALAQPTGAGKYIYYGKRVFHLLLGGRLDWSRIPGAPAPGQSFVRAIT